MNGLTYLRWTLPSVDGNGFFIMGNDLKWVTFCFNNSTGNFKKVFLNKFSLMRKLVHMVRSSRPEVFCKKGVLRNFTKFTGKHLCQSFFFNKVAGLRPATLLKKRLWHRCFPVNFVELLRTPLLTEHIRWLLLNS